jgi:hypothetical protein
MKKIKELSGFGSDSTRGAITDTMTFLLSEDGEPEHLVMMMKCVPSEWSAGEGEESWNVSAVYELVLSSKFRQFELQKVELKEAELKVLEAECLKKVQQLEARRRRC